jgi:hypothetical protein
VTTERLPSILLFGSSGLTYKHLRTVASELDMEKMRAWGVDFSRGVRIVNGDGPPSNRGVDRRGTIGADRLVLCALQLAWDGVNIRMSWHPVRQQQGETWGEAAIRRDREMAALRPDRALCFHTDPNLGKGSAVTAHALQQNGVPLRVVLMTEAGALVDVSDR